VTYYGDGRYLQNVVGFAVSLQSAVSDPVYPMFANNAGVTTAGISTTKLVFVPSSGNLGLGTTNPQGTFQVGTAITMYGFTGIISATKYYGDGSSLTGSIPNSVTNIDTNAIYYPLLSQSISGSISSITVSSTSIVFNPGPNYLGIGSTAPTTNLDVFGNIKASGIISATTFYGSAAGLTDIPPAPGEINITDTTTNATYYPTFTVGTGYTAGLNVTTTKFTFNPSTSVLTVKGTPYFGDTNSSIALTNPLAVFTSNVNTYSQVQVQNLFAGGSSSASVDFVATTDSGTDSAEYIDMGINNSGFTAAGLWNAKDGYLYVHAPTAGNGGNLVVGTSGAANRDIIFHTGGTATTNERMRVSDTKVTIQDNVEVTSGSIYGKVLAATYGMFMP